MTIALETEIVGSAFDPVRQVYTYTIERAGQRWTVEVPDAHLAQHAGQFADTARRDHVASVLHGAMAGPADGDAS